MNEPNEPNKTNEQNRTDEPNKNPKQGSPTSFPRANSGISGTASELSTGEQIKPTEQEPDTIRAGPVPLFLIPQTLSTEIHAHGGRISGISIRRTGQHVYAITLTKNGPQGTKTGSKARTKVGKNTGSNTGTNTGERHAA